MSADKELGASLIGPLIGEAASLVAPERLDTYEEILILEKRHVALDFVRNKYALADMSPKDRALAPLTNPTHAVEYINNQFATKIIPAFLAGDVETGLAILRSISAHTTQEEMTLLINDDEFRQMHAELQQYLEEVSEAITSEVKERLDPVKGQIAKNDTMQFRGTETSRSLENVLQNGIQLAVEESGIEYLREMHELCGAGVIPLTELIKNQRILTINGFNNSKISLATHDAMDHAWTMNMLRERGYLEDYRPFLQSIGNPDLTNIFLREGEAIASIAYGARYWAMMEQGFVPIISAGDLRVVMDEMFEKGLLTENRQMRAYRTLRSLKPDSREWQSLGFTFSNYVTELDEQRRKHGKIKQRDMRTYKVVDELDVMHPDFLSLFIETHHEILNSRNKHRDDLFRFHIILEGYLTGIAEGTIPQDQELQLKIQSMAELDFSRTNLPAERLQWMRHNYGYTSVKDSIY